MVPRPTRWALVVCGDVHITIFEVRRGLDIHLYASCEVILGSIIYAPMPFTTNTTTTPSVPVRFPYLREVNGYMLLGYSLVHSFSSMFPRLSIIHGRELYHGYALIVMENLQLDELGLTSLINIRRGNVIIARNAQLCYANSIRWKDIIEDPKAQVILRQNRDDCAFCPTCPSACWSPTQCQQQCSAHCKGNCLTETVCCPDQCVGGCYYQNITASTDLICHACRNMRIYATGKCVQKCPSHMLKVIDSLCVTHQECTSFFMSSGFILDETNECVSTCPTGFDVILGSHCERCISGPENNYCQGACGEQHIRSISEFSALKYCSRVHTLNIYNIAAVESTETNLIEVFTAFESLEQIDHEFTIHNVNIFSTLSIFSKLKRIGITTNATMTIEENDFLTELWPLSHPPPIIQGSLNIVRNARLCLKRIEDFINYTNTRETDLQITPNTKNEYANGYLASCESNQLTLSVDRIRSLTAKILVTVPKELFFRPNGKNDYLRRPFLSVYYKTTQTRNETHFDATQSHKWLRIVEKINYNPSPHGSSFTMNVDLVSLLGATWYAVYASITSNVNTVGLYSTIGYFRTLPRQPEPILNLRGESLSRSSIELMWQPPSKPNGDIALYLIYYAPVEDRLPIDNPKLLCLMKDKVPKFICNERAFFNNQTNSFDKTYTYSYDGFNCKTSLPKIPNENQITSTLLSIRHLVLRIAVFYERKTTTEMVFGSGCLITNKLLLTSGHTFDPIQWGTDKVSYSKILVAFCDPVPDTVFSFLNPHQTVYQAKIIQRGIVEDHITDYTEIKDNYTDLALLELDNEVENVTMDQYFDPKFDLKSSKLVDVLLNSKLYLIGYNGELIDQDELKPYQYLKDFNDLTIDKLNIYHNVNYKSISIGNLIKEASESDQYSLHNCSTLSGSSGSIILNCYGSLAGIHIGINNFRKGRENDIFFNTETYNKYVSIKSNQFRTFIRETVLPNIKHDELVKKWLLDSK
ncbi:unnamed protein product [Rotaria sp. Silwood2]|nr:unnamed protein product [Rotaria sp. Silwood2]